LRRFFSLKKHAGEVISGIVFVCGAGLFLPGRAEQISGSDLHAKLL
jgi:hypothetical protein